MVRQHLFKALQPVGVAALSGFFVFNYFYFIISPPIF